MGVATRRLASTGVALVSSTDLRTCLGIGDAAWRRFAAHWDRLAPDRYAAQLGTHRLRRYGHFYFRAADEHAERLPHAAFVQPDESNPLYVETDRHFQPLTDTFVDDPVLRRLLPAIGRIAHALDGTAHWSVKVTPFRVLASAGDTAQPTPEGLHRDGVTMVATLLIARTNAVGGESSVVDLAGRRLLATTLREPGTLLVGDDRHTMHAVSPLRPADPAERARRDVLVITFAPSEQPSMAHVSR